MSMPDEFYLPQPKDFCRGDFTEEENGKKHCFVGWQRELLPFPMIWMQSTASDRKDINRFFDVALKTARKLKLYPHLRENANPTCFVLNDDLRNTPTQLAEWFEETVKALGYDVK